MGTGNLVCLCTLTSTPFRKEISLLTCIDDGIGDLRFLAGGPLEPPLDPRCAEGVANLLGELGDLRLGVGVE